MNYKYSMDASVLDNLFIEKKKTLKRMIGNLQIDNVKSDTRFASTVNSIKQAVLLKPVTIGEPRITGNHQKERQVSAHYQNMWGGSQMVNVITVEFSYTGSSELFSYRVSNQSLTVDRIYNPFYNTIEVKVSQLDKNQALSEAKNKLATTKQLIQQNNSVVEQWSANMENRIQTLAEEKRTDRVL